MMEQILFVERRDGVDGAVDYCRRVLKAYRGAAKYRSDTGRRLHCHIPLYRPHFVRSILDIRAYLKAKS